jgi:hypothetical protein
VGAEFRLAKHFGGGAAARSQAILVRERMAGDDVAATSPAAAAAAPQGGWRRALETFAAAGAGADAAGDGDSSLMIDAVLDSTERAVLHTAGAHTRPLLSST